MVRQELARLTNIQDTVRKYVNLNGQLECQCPFHKGPNPTLKWNPKKGTYRCEVCQTSGDIVDFMMKMEGWTYFDTYQKLAGRLRYQKKGIVYILACADDCYYVGYTLDLVNRLNLHFNGKGAYWTKLHPPIRLVDALYDVTYAQEDKTTMEYLAKYGRDKVRGGCFVGAELD